jgi:type I restriction enzyme S subunit
VYDTPHITEGSSYLGKVSSDAHHKIIGRKGQLGEAYYIEGPFWPHDTSLWVKNFHENLPRFIALFLKSLRLQRFDAATSVPTLNRNFIHPLIVAIPPPDEQALICDMVEVHEVHIRAEEAYRDKLKQIKKGLMHDLLTGRVRVTQAEATV